MVGPIIFSFFHWIMGIVFFTLAVASAKGVSDAVFIVYVVWPALRLYHVTDQAGGYDALRQGITRFSRNELGMASKACPSQ